MRSLLVLALLFMCLPAEAQDPVQERRIENQKQNALKKTEMRRLFTPQPLVFDFGGTLNYRYDHYRDDDNDASARDSLDYSHTADLRLWFKALYKEEKSANRYGLYVRLKNILTLMKEPADVNKSFDNRGPLLDLGYASFSRKNFAVEAGRRFFQLGSGIALNNSADGAEISFQYKKFAVKAMGLHNLPHEGNIDFSVPGGSKESKRTFWGLQTDYALLPNHSVYAYALTQRDQSDENPVDAAHDYSYNSQYFGGGINGRLVERSRYWFEAILETGKSRVYDTSEKKEIRAHAFDTGIAYTVDTYSAPRISAEYAYGSGDSDRTSVTNTSGGNTSGRDGNFLYFGYLNTGYALSPLLSNLQFYRVGAVATPFERSLFLKNLDVGIDYYRFYKNKKTGGIYDFDATVAERYIGQELDLTFTYRIFSDLTTALEYGYFIPGGAYADGANDSEEYLSMSMRLSF